jgi:release factor glutamine methyltransferase
MTPYMAENKIWKVIDIINWGKDYLIDKKIPDARLNIELLLCKIVKCRRIELYLNFDKPLTANELAEFKILLKRRLNFEPLQYILGETEFMGLTFFLNDNVLIPRPETELLVEECINFCKQNLKGKETISILDIGTGSGNIAVSLGKLIPNSFITSIDLNEDILNIAKENAKTNSVEDRIDFRVLNFLETPLDNLEFDVIVSNPPYIDVSEYELLDPELKNFEPKHALTDFSDGLTFYKKISEISKSILKPNGLIAVEIAYNQKERVETVFRNSGYSNFVIKKDYANIDRIVLITNGV